jgi:hypothetical protein
MGAEFLAMLLVVVYVGAVAVLFLFVVMMLDVDFAELRAGLPAISADRRADRRVSCWRAAGRLGAWVGGARRRADRAAPTHARRPSPTPRRSAACSTPTMSILPGGGPGAAGRDDRRHRADAAPPQGRQAQNIAARTRARATPSNVKVKSSGAGGLS